MIKRLTIALLTSFLCTASNPLWACSCAPRDLDALSRDSDFVYFAEVTLVRLVTRKAPHNSRVTYEAELRPLRRFKGGDPGVQKVRYTSTYHDNSPELASTDSEGREFVINSCDQSYRVGQVFLIFKKRNVALGDVGYCTPRVVSNPTAEHVRILERLLP